MMTCKARKYNIAGSEQDRVDGHWKEWGRYVNFREFQGIFFDWMMEVLKCCNTVTELESRWQVGTENQNNHRRKT